MIDVFVLGVAGMTAHPAPLDGQVVCGGAELEPQLEILDRATLPIPPPSRPAMNPFLHSLREVTAVGIENDSSGSFETPEPLDGAAQSHAIIGGVGFRDVVVTARPAPLFVERLDRAGGAAGVTTIGELVAEAGLVGVDVDQAIGSGSVHVD